MKMSRVSDKGNLKRWGVLALASAVLVCLIATQADAQRRGRARLRPERQAAAWTLEAQCVAKSLSLSAAKTDQVVKAYIASRKSEQESAAKITESGRARFRAWRKISHTEREALKKNLASILSKDQIEKAVGPLGTYDRRWDRMVNIIAGFKLDAAKQDKALAAVAMFVEDSRAAMAKAFASGDRASVRSTMHELRGKLDTELGKVLSAEQMTKWKEDTSFRRGGRHGGRHHRRGRRG